jgi:hypothetical protein
VEQSAEAKGNASQQSTGRASRMRSSADDTVARFCDDTKRPLGSLANLSVAKSRKKEKFTALLHHISTDLLEEAFFELKEDAAPGVDRLRTTKQSSSAISRTCMHVSIGEHIGHCRHGASTYPSRTVAGGRSRSQR